MQSTFKFRKQFMVLVLYERELITQGSPKILGLLSKLSYDKQKDHLVNGFLCNVCTHFVHHFQEQCLGKILYFLQ